KNSDRFCAKALGLGILLSSAIEFTQFFIPGRGTQVTDVLTNGLGAWLGAMVFGLFMRSSKESYVIRLFAPELPLMNWVYLLIPLMWLNGLSTGGEAARLWLLLLLGLMGGGVLASIYVHRLKQEGRLTPNKLSLLVSGWFIVASLPTLARFPIEVAGFGIVIAALVQIPARLPIRKKKGERRFELSTLKIILPFYAVYLILLALWPTIVPFEGWQLKTYFQDLASSFRNVSIFRFIEIIGALTLFGYMIAEIRGREKESLKAALVWIFLTALGSSAAFGIVKAYPPPLVSGILEILLMTAAGVYGGVIYRLQLAAIRHL
ncbi:MAG: VanZ family protein, partial [Desulfatiglandaceae bacterium]